MPALPRPIDCPAASPVADREAGRLQDRFARRGAAIPFTTPLLSGARGRHSRRGELELILPNPSGGRGVYVLPWAEAPALGRLTLHDQRLRPLIAELPAITPGAIRRVSRRVAAEGVAGRSVSGAALRAEQDEAQARLLTNFDLLLELVRQVEPPGENPVPPDEEVPAVLERRGRQAIARIAPSLTRSAEAVAASLEQLAGAFSGVGVGRHLHGARLPQALARLEALRAALGEHLRCCPTESAEEALHISAAIDGTAAATRTALVQAQALTRDVVSLLRRWSTAPTAIAEALARPEWLLDGWDRLAALWHGADSYRGRAATLVEMAGLVPPLARGDPGADVECEAPRRPRVALLEDWRTGVTLHDLIARNESLLELAA